MKPQCLYKVLDNSNCRKRKIKKGRKEGNTGVRKKEKREGGRIEGRRKRERGEGRKERR